MLHRREFLLGSIGTGIVALAGDCYATPATDPILDALKATVGMHDKVAGMVAIVIDENGSRMVSYGSSGVPSVALDGNTVFEIMSITKVLTSLLLTEMAARGEVALDDPLAKYLPPSVTLHEHGRPITLIDLATYTSGLPNMPGNLPPNWYDLPNPMRNYTLTELYGFLSSYVPKYEPGTHYEYANMSFGLLGNALARRAGKSYEDLLIEQVCIPLGLADTRITLTGEMRRRLVQGHDIGMKQTLLWDWPAMPGAGCVRSTAQNLAAFLKANMGLVHSPLNASMAQLIKTRKPTPLVGTDTGLGWFISTDGKEEIVWKSGLSSGCNTFIGYSTQRRRGAVLLSNFLWSPIDMGTINVGIRMIAPDFPTVNFNLLYV